MEATEILGEEELNEMAAQATMMANSILASVIKAGEKGANPLTQIAGMIALGVVYHEELSEGNRAILDEVTKRASNILGIAMKIGEAVSPDHADDEKRHSQRN